MALIVQKFGGTSVGSVERIRNVARRVAKWKAAGHDLVVVPSAMAGETNRLIGLAREIQAHPDPRELDVVAATGEQVTIGLLAMALLELGVKAVSYAGWQVKRSEEHTSELQSPDQHSFPTRRSSDLGHDLVVVPSAMAGETNRLIGLAREIQAHPDPRELDVVAATGEQVTIGLLAMALLELGVKAVSYAGWQVK